MVTLSYASRVATAVARRSRDNARAPPYPRVTGTFIFWVADWFALMNDKMGGDLDKIKTVGEYLVEVRGRPARMSASQSDQIRAARSRSSRPHNRIVPDVANQIRSDIRAAVELVTCLSVLTFYSVKL